MSEIQAHLSEAKRFLEAAKSDLERGDYKRAVSSAYYCAFHAVRALLLSEGVSPRTHEGLLRQFGRVFIKSKGFARELGIALADLKRRRELSDYVPSSTFSKEGAVNAIRKAERLLAKAKGYLSRI